MKKYIIVLVLAIGLPLSFAYGQHRSKIKVAYPSMLNSQEQEDVSIQKVMSKYLKNHYFVQNEIFTTKFYHRDYQNKIVSRDINGLINKNVITYYNLENKYDSPLKLKIFKQSSEYQQLLERLEKEYTYLLEDTFYIAQRVEKTYYDLDKKSFFFSVPSSSIVYTTTRYIQFNEDVGIITTLLKNDELQVEIDDEQIALDVENNYNDCRLVYVFTINEDLSKKFETRVIGDLQKLFLINIKSGRVYYYGQIKKDPQKETIKLLPYDHDIYVYDKPFSIEIADPEPSDHVTIVTQTNPVYYLKAGDKFVELEDDEDSPITVYEDYLLEEIDGKYYVTGKNGKKYQLSFKPKGVIMAEKEYDYETKCEEIAKDYKLHPENYEDVTIVTPDGLGHYYVDKEGFDWTFETEGLPYSKLETEGVYMIFDELKFVRRKADSR